MTATETQFVTDERGDRVAVLIGIERYRELLDALDEIDAIRAYDEATASGETPIGFEDAVREFERDRETG